MKDTGLLWLRALPVSTWSFVQGSWPGLHIPYLAPVEPVLPAVPELLGFSGGVADGYQVLGMMTVAR